MARYSPFYAESVLKHQLTNQPSRARASALQVSALGCVQTNIV